MVHAYTQSLKNNTYHIVRLYGRKKNEKRAINRRNVRKTNENAGVKFYARFFMSKYLIYVPKKIRTGVFYF